MRKLTHDFNTPDILGMFFFTTKLSSAVLRKSTWKEPQTSRTQINLHKKQAGEITGPGIQTRMLIEITFLYPIIHILILDLVHLFISIHIPINVQRFFIFDDGLCGASTTMKPLVI